ncbi:MAG: hypothetical protein H0T69_17640 [Thermoleophilaceae bacterium]|nr:hypothetical protein [Thermoleophilaceae bacterium]
MRKFLKHNGLSVFFLALFLAALVGQAFAGHADFNEGQLRHGDPTMSMGRYVLSSAFGTAVLENWQSEYLQFTLFILTTIWLLQRGSPESKPLNRAGRESDQDQKVGPHARKDSPGWAKVAGFRRVLYENSLLVVMAAIWVGSWFAQSITGVNEYNTGRLDHHQLPVSWLNYLGRPDFWEKTLQNWQSEFLAVGSMAILAVYLRQRGSPESKPVGAPHEATGVEG